MDRPRGSILPREINQTEKDKYCIIRLVVDGFISHFAVIGEKGQDIQLQNMS